MFQCIWAWKVQLILVYIHVFVNYLVNYLGEDQQDAHQRGLGLSGLIHKEAHPTASNFS